MLILATFSILKVRKDLMNRSRVGAWKFFRIGRTRKITRRNWRLHITISEWNAFTGAIRNLQLSISKEKSTTVLDVDGNVVGEGEMLDISAVDMSVYSKNSIRIGLSTIVTNN